MKTCLAVLAHQGAGETIADFQPRWQKLGLPILAFLPEGDQWPGAPVAKVFNQGTSAHRGLAAYMRFMLMCEALLESEYDTYIIIEYDTVNLTDRLPSFAPSNLNCAFLRTFGEECEKLLRCKNYVIALSPWIVSREVMRGWLDAMRIRFAKPIFTQWIDGLLDRWLAVVIMEGKILANNITQAYSWPCNDPQAHEKIEKHKWEWIHGWKRKSDFKHLWPEQ